ncbi:hypothetical protein A6A27_40450 [Micromonospora sp. CB01531]|nr:hypothetical protein A6A27_40450 [Micromonospora sp. CB01531]
MLAELVGPGSWEFLGAQRLTWVTGERRRQLREQAQGLGVDVWLREQAQISGVPFEELPDEAFVSALRDLGVEFRSDVADMQRRWPLYARSLLRETLASLIDGGDLGVLDRLEEFADLRSVPLGVGVTGRALLLQLVVGARREGRPLRGIDVSLAAVGDHRLWDTVAGDDVASLLNMGLGVGVVERGVVAYPRDIDGVLPVYVVRSGRHFQALQPVLQYDLTLPQVIGSSAAALLDPSISVEARRVGGLPVVGAARAGTPSREVRAAVERASVEGEGVNCVVGVGRVLAAIGPPSLPAQTPWDDSMLPNRSANIAQWLGGHFQDGLVAELLDLKPGHVTAVRLQPPNQEAHIVIVERVDDGYLVIDPTKREDDGRFEAFHPSTSVAELPSQLRVPVRLIRRPDSRLGQLAVPADGVSRPDPDTLALGEWARGGSGGVWSGMGRRSSPWALGQLRAAVRTANDTGPAAGASVDRLIGWMAAVPQDRDSGYEPGPWDCVPLAWGVFIAMHARIGNRHVSDDTWLDDPTDLHSLEQALNGTLTRTDDAVLRAALRARPGAMALVSVRPPGRESHAFWLLSDAQGTLMLIDPITSAAPQPVALPNGAEDERVTWLALPDTRVLFLALDGRPAPPEALAGPQPQATTSGSHTLQALLDPPATTRHGMYRPHQTRDGQPAAGSSTMPGIQLARPAGTSDTPGQGTQPLPGAVAVLEEARQYVGYLRWRGGAAPSPRDGWQISETIGGGRHVNDFARWIRGTGAVPDRNGTMAAHEAIFFAAYQAGQVSLPWLQRVYAQAAERANSIQAGQVSLTWPRRVYAQAAEGANSIFRRFQRRNPDANHSSLPNVGDGYGDNRMTVSEVAFQSVLAEYLAPGPRHRYDINPDIGVGGPDIPAGHVILFDGINGHVALSLGIRDLDGRQLVISHWDRPHSTPPDSRGRRSTGFLQITTVEDLLFSGHDNTPRFRVIEFAAPPWASPATMVVAAARQLHGKLRWRGGNRVDGGSWNVLETTITGYPNDMALWLHGKGREPTDDSTMNCWDAILFSAYQAGVIDKLWIESLYARSASAASGAVLRTIRYDPDTYSYTSPSEPDRYGRDSSIPQVTYYDSIMQGMASGALQRYTIDPSTGVGYPDIPSGYIIFFDGIRHVAISLGTRDAQGRLEIMNHWIFPFPHMLTPNDQRNVGFMQPTTIEEIAAATNFQAIEFGAPRWG